MISNQALREEVTEKLQVTLKLSFDKIYVASVGTEGMTPEGCGIVTVRQFGSESLDLRRELLVTESHEQDSWGAGSEGALGPGLRAH